MSFFSKLLGSFKKPEPVAPLHLTLQQALDRLQVEEERSQTEWGTLLEEIRNELDAVSARMDEEIEKLFSTVLPNKNIEVRHRQIMEGNRDAYARKVGAFRDQVVQRFSSDTLKRATIVDLRSRQEDLLRGTQKSYHVLQEFLANESRKIAGSLKAIDQLITRADDGLKRRGDRQEALRKMARRIERVLRRESEDPAAELNEAKSLVAKHEKALATFRKGKEYISMQKVMEREEELAASMAATAGELTRLLSAIERPLRKYERVAMDGKAVGRVMAADAEDLLSDPDPLKKVIPQLRKSIESGGITLKDRQKDSSLQAIDELALKLDELTESYASQAEELASGDRASLEKVRQEEVRLERSLELASVKLHEIQAAQEQEEPDLPLEEMKSQLSDLLGAPVTLDV